MNQPTRGEFEDIKKRVEKLEQQTEPIKITRIEIEQPRDMLQDISRKQDEHERLLIAHSKGISTLQTEMQGARADITSIRATQSDHGELLKSLKATQDEHSSLLKQILAKLP